MINYDSRIFRSVSNTAGGEVGGDTLFYYHQTDNVVWAEYVGGEIVRGHLVAIADANGVLDMRYHHVNQHGEMMTGNCTSTPEILAEGRIRLHEKWQWTCSDFGHGESVVEQMRPVSDDCS